MNWQTRRKFIYALSLGIFLISCTVYFLQDTIFPDPTCGDGTKNGHEVGVDCGGLCALRCTSEVTPLTVLWSRAVQTNRGMYDLVAMVSNKNIDNASHEAEYEFTVFGSNGELLKSIKGKTSTPIDGDFPIIEQSVSMNQVPVTVTLQITDGPHYTVHEKPTSPTIRIINERYESGDTPRVYARVMNTKRTTITDLDVLVVLYDEDNNAYATGKSHIKRLDKEEIKDVIFTWNAPFVSPPVRIKVFPVFDPFIIVE